MTLGDIEGHPIENVAVQPVHHCELEWSPNGARLQQGPVTGRQGDKSAPRGNLLKFEAAVDELDRAVFDADLLNDVEREALAGAKIGDAFHQVAALVQAALGVTHLVDDAFAADGVGDTDPDQSWRLGADLFVGIAERLVNTF